MRPDKVRGVIGLSVPHRPRSSRPRWSRCAACSAKASTWCASRSRTRRRPNSTATAPPPSAACSTASRATALPAPDRPEGGGFLDTLPEPEKLPAWLTDADIATYVEEYADSGFTGPVNWYRNLDRNWELTAAWHRAHIGPPALCIAGDRDLVAVGARDAIDSMTDFVPNLRDTVWLSGCGHWTQQERPTEVNNAILTFLRAL